MQGLRQAERQLKQLNTRLESLEKSWIKWMPEGAPEPELITRQQLVRQLGERGIRVTQTDFIYWQSESIMPNPVKRFHDGATCGLYPDFMADLVERLLALKKQGRTIRSLGPDMRALFAEMALGKSANVGSDKCPLCGCSMKMAGLDDEAITVLIAEQANVAAASQDALGRVFSSGGI